MTAGKNNRTSALAGQPAHQTGFADGIDACMSQSGGLTGPPDAVPHKSRSGLVGKGYMRKFSPR